MDADSTPAVRELGTARLLLASTALQSLARTAITTLPQWTTAPAALVQSLLETHLALSLEVMAGQHQDLAAEQEPPAQFPVERCLQITRMKSGSLMQLACRLGAQSGGAEPAVCELFAALGVWLGMAHQLDNDSLDLYHEVHTPPSPPGAGEVRKSDLARGKKTLPIVLAAQGRQAVYRDSPPPAGKETVSDQEVFEQAIVVARGISLLYRERARECMHDIQARTRPFEQPLEQLLLGTYDVPAQTNR
jgi:geranylgeranyl pyrophosphate synthase